MFSQFVEIYIFMEDLFKHALNNQDNMLKYSM